MKKALIIGGGFAGCAAAHQFALAGGWDVTLIEASEQLGAGVRTQWLGGHPYTFGPRHFLTQNEAVWEYMNKYVPLRRCNEHQFLTYVEQDMAFYNYPIHRDDIARMPDRDRVEYELENQAFHHPPQNFEQFWQDSIGDTLYNKFINSYSKKMWGVKSNAEIDTFSWSPKGVTIKSGPRAGWDTALSGYPLAKTGYDDYFVLATEDTEVLLNTKVKYWDVPSRLAFTEHECIAYDILVNTISPDQMIYDSGFDELKFMGRRIEPVILPIEFALPPDVYFSYYAGDERYTRITEYKKFTRHVDPSSTLITLEYPDANAGRLYPLPLRSEQEKAQRYFSLMPEGVYSLGRAGSYNYAVDMDDCIAQAMEMMKKIKAGGRDHPVPIFGNPAKQQK